MPKEMMVERQPSPEQEHIFKLVLMKMLFLGHKHHPRQVFYSKESCSKLPYMATTQIT